ncbi:MAG: 1-phosphatidylinositol-3-phosphate 5-kinase [Watsoniomyces obsoletus]|nr:MAG: 1-phosphatidylinositol-3-phosphate 5-kinase [Watsoniomyces obsoletus]
MATPNESDPAESVKDGGATLAPPRSPRAVSLSGTVGSESDSMSQVLIPRNCSTLTAFHDFSTPPLSSSAQDNENTGDLVQSGLSVLYNRIRGVVVRDHGAVEGKHSKGGHAGAPEVENKDVLEAHPPPHHVGEPLQDEPRSTARTSSNASTAPQDSSTMPRAVKGTLALLSKPAVSNPVEPELVPVNVDSDAEGLLRKDRHLMSPASEITSIFDNDDLMVHRANDGDRLTRLRKDDNDPSAGAVAAEDLRSYSHSSGAGLSKTATVRDDRGRVSSPSGLSGTGQPITTNDHRSASSANREQLRSPGQATATASDNGNPRLGSEPRKDTPKHPGLSGASSFDTTNPVGQRPMAPNYPLGGGVRQSRSTSRRRRAGAPDETAAAASKPIMVLNKDFWMADASCNECFNCGDAFSALYRRKHHCRTCGQIFDAKCTSLIPGAAYGQVGSLRVCRPCKEIINSYDHADDSDRYSETATSTRAEPLGTSWNEKNLETSSAGPPDQTQMKTPMVAMGGGSKRGSTVVEIPREEYPSRPGSSRSSRTSMASRPFASHQRHRSKLFHTRSFRAAIPEEQAPFHRYSNEETQSEQRLPAFHNDSIIDPDLAPYMSDDGSSADEHMSLSAAMNGDAGFSGLADSDRNSMNVMFNSPRKSRLKFDDASVGAISVASRDGDDPLSMSRSGHQMATRSRVSHGGSPTHHRLFPRVPRGSQILKSIGSTLPDVLGTLAGLPQQTQAPAEPPTQPSRSRMTKSASMKGASAPPVELNNASLQHVQRLLRQLLQDANLPDVDAWVRALMPILLQCTDDVNPDVRRGDDIDIRHYVKVKRIPGGVPADTSYISGVVFSKNLALKCMPRSISHPTIMIISFPIEYHRHQQHFMSLGPVIAQEKEYLASLVKRIVALRPQFLLAQRNVSGLAVQLLNDANVAVAYNVKPAVLEAVSRCAETEIISSVDMLVLKSIHIGSCDGLDVKTYVHKDIPGKKKTFIYLSGCPPELGCTIVLRGENMRRLAKLKRITEFMVYVVYSLKLETCLMRDEFVLIPSMTDIGTLSQESEFEKRKGHCLRGENGQVSLLKDNVAPSNSTQSSESDEKEQKPAGNTDPTNTPAPNFYGDMVEKHQTKILSASPFVKFMQPYLLMRAREQESRLACLKLMLDQDIKQKAASDGQSAPQRFSLVQPEMVHQTLEGAPQKVIEVLHAVHDAEYDKALYIYETQKRQWEAYVAGNVDLFDPYAHQNIVVLYSLVCTATATPCIGPDLLALAYYNEHATVADFTPDCTLGQFVEDLCYGAHETCSANGCDKRMTEHHRSYVHGEGRISIFLEEYSCKLRGLQDSILMWSCCKICQKETQVVPMSDNTWRYSFGKYLEISFWSYNLRLKAGVCPHDLHRDHLRYFGYKDLALRVHYDPIELLEIVVPRARITWNVENDLRLKNEMYTKTEERLNRFMTSVKARLKGISASMVIAEKADEFKVEIEKLIKRANDDHIRLVRKLQKRYMNSKYYEIIPLNRAARVLQTKVAEWDAAFAEFEANFFPSEKDIRRLAVAQMKRMFLDRDNSTPSMTTTEDGSSTHTAESDETQKTAVAKLEQLQRPSQMTEKQAHDVLAAVVHEDSSVGQGKGDAVQDAEKMDSGIVGSGSLKPSDLQEQLGERVPHLDLATSPPLHKLTVDLPPLPRSPSPATTSFSNQQTPDPGAERTAISPGPDAAKKPSKPSSIPRPVESYRKRQLAGSPPLLRTRSQPGPGEIDPRSKPAINFPATVKEGFERQDNDVQDQTKSLQAIITEKRAEVDSKSAKRTTRSNIPRSVPSKKRNTQVSALAQHFEQLSREFEKERLREKQQRVAKTRRARVHPVTSSKPIVEVYQNALEAVDEHEPSDLEVSIPQTQSSTEATSVVDPSTEHSTAPTSLVESPVESFEEAKKETKQDLQETSDAGHETAESGSESDASSGLMDDIHLPSVEEISESLSYPDTKVELPKHERSSVMKMLTNFWAERSASGWAPLDYPMAAFDHVFLDSDVIIREDEPSSLIAFALSSEDYKAKLHSICERGRERKASEEAPSMEQSGQTVEKSLLRSTGTHLKYQFQEGSAKMLCKIFYAEQFDAVRRQCGVADRIVESLSRCVKWDSKGGKTRSVFLKTLDERFVLKSLSPIETQAFLRFAPAYFQIMSEALFHELPTVIAKMLGFYQIVVRNPTTGTELRLDLLVMENLFYDRTPTRIFDLKGSMRNRKIQSTGKQDEVLLDENMVEFIYESPLFVREHSKKLLRASVWNDTLFLARQDVMDYSLMIAVDESRKELVVGIIDCIRTYTWDKKLESWIKDRGFAGGGKNKPTVTSPKEYKSRFREAMARYVLQAPNCWHQFQAYNQQGSVSATPSTTTVPQKLSESVLVEK